MITLETSGPTLSPNNWPLQRIDCQICKASVEFMYKMPRLCTSCLSSLDACEEIFEKAEHRLVFHRRLSTFTNLYGEVW